MYKNQITLSEYVSLEFLLRGEESSVLTNRLMPIVFSVNFYRL